MKICYDNTVFKLIVDEKFRNFCNNLSHVINENLDDVDCKVSYLCNRPGEYDVMEDKIYISWAIVVPLYLKYDIYNPSDEENCFLYEVLIDEIAHAKTGGYDHGSEVYERKHNYYRMCLQNYINQATH